MSSATPHRAPTKLYLISPVEIADPAKFLPIALETAEAGKAASFQLRLKKDWVCAPDEEIIAAANILFPPLQALGVACLINDRPDLIIPCGADGVHIGQKDGNAKNIRKQIGDAIMGVTCHDSRHLGMEAAEAGADYVAFGAFYETQTKDGTRQAEPDVLTWWQEMMEVPCVAIGGITKDNCMPLVEAGADFLAICNGIWAAPNGPAAAAADILAQTRAFYQAHNG